MGNFLENAIEACRRQSEGKRFIRLKSRTQNGTLVITTDNSFDGEYMERGGVFFSSKRDGEGVGLSSVRAVVREYGGNVRFEAADRVFMSSVYMDMSGSVPSSEKQKDAVVI